MLEKSFYTDTENIVSSSFRKNGYIIVKANNKKIEEFRNKITVRVCKILNIKFPKNVNEFLNNFHKKISISRLNSIRIALYNDLNESDWFRPTYYHLGKKYLDALVGNELSMQNKINLSIQVPKDNNSLIDMHSDVFTGETPFQAVLWIPLVDVSKSKSMFISSVKDNKKIYQSLKKYNNLGMTNVYKDYKNKFKFLEINFGEILIFSPILMHGNTINKTNETRFSLNCRFTSLFSPYNEDKDNQKKLGTFYLPINTKPLTKIGINFKKPKGF